MGPLSAPIKLVDKTGIAEILEVAWLEKALRREIARQWAAFADFLEHGLHAVARDLGYAFDVVLRIDFVNLFGFRCDFRPGVFFDGREGHPTIAFEPVNAFDKGARETNHQIGMALREGFARGHRAVEVRPPQCRAA